ncbi:MAG: hypothetical protein QF473_18235 [Planctomycetota bacterium]|nr:hypothetical protein [Planctomycetota bacterium]MDP6357058.1 hypothetical protein [Planctomycetota bacterium]MDP7251999.1 hypothetical protein [Planctomycetota bacterium]
MKTISQPRVAALPPRASIIAGMTTDSVLKIQPQRTVMMFATIDMKFRLVFGCSSDAMRVAGQTA